MGPPGNRGSWAPVSLPKLKKAYEKGTRGISWGPLLIPGPGAVLEFPNGQSAPAVDQVPAVGSDTRVHRFAYIAGGHKV
ncbi:unnamed protein product [Staurois parvus]|uniref:Uncharacterized protein n=1 Tax=Staurois parvus TaxID=386267 RepID=A0ABN9HCY9_9NEOB|nr:unnamed protein product [Staurois parvus]